MSVFKQFNTNEVVITPFYANKGFRFVGSQITASDVGIEYYQSMQGPYVTGSQLTGFGTILNEVLVFNNVKQLYYSNYLTASTGDNFSTQSLIPGATPEYNSYVGITTGPRFDNFLQSSIQQNRQFAQFSASDATTGPSVISIPSKLFGEKIPPSTFNFTYTSSNPPYIESFVHDDSEGNLMATQSNPDGTIVYTGSVGQIFYSQGIAVLTGIDEGNLSDFAKLVNTVGLGAPLIPSSEILSYTTQTIPGGMGSERGPFTITPNSPVTLGSQQNGAGASFNLTCLPNGITLVDVRVVSAGNNYVVGNKITITQSELIAAGFSGASGTVVITVDASYLGTPSDSNYENLNSASLAFSSSITIRENQYKCTVNDNEYSYTTNPSALRPLNQLTTVNNAISESISSTTYGDNGTPGVYTLILTPSAPSEGIGGTATVTVASDSTISNITTNNPGRNFLPGDILTIDPSTIAGASGLISVTLTTSDIVNTSNISNQGENYYDFATGSYFSPYVTTIGLYNESYQLVAVGKLAQPIPISLYTDTTFVVNFDT